MKIILVLFCIFLLSGCNSEFFVGKQGIENETSYVEKDKETKNIQKSLAPKNEWYTAKSKYFDIKSQFNFVKNDGVETFIAKNNNYYTTDYVLRFIDYNSLENEKDKETFEIYKELVKTKTSQALSIPFLLENDVKKYSWLVTVRELLWEKYKKVVFVVSLEGEENQEIPNIIVNVYDIINENVLLNLRISPQTNFWSKTELNFCEKQDVLCFKDKYLNNPVLQGRINELVEKSLTKINLLNL